VTIAPLNATEARGLHCAEADEHCGGDLWQVRMKNQAGPIVVCEDHLFRLGRSIADTLQAKRLTDKPNPDAKPFTWG
jgi:hypothetical protein